MPEDFMKCKAEGGKMRTMKMSGGKYAHVCIDKNGKTHMGEIKEKMGMEGAAFLKDKK